jgi:hypothetical protein
MTFERCRPMFSDSPNWAVMEEPALRVEAAALDRIRDLLPGDGIARAWAMHAVIDGSGRREEINVLPSTPSGWAR